MVQKAKTATPKPDPIIQALQRELKQQGYYSGEIDGQAGGKTTEAVARRDAAMQRNNELELERVRLQQSGQQTEAATAESTRLTQARQRRAEEAATPLGIGTQIAATTAAPIAGTAAGMALGEGTNYMLDRAQESRNKVLRGVAADRTAGLTTRDGAREAARLSGAVPMNNSALRTGARMLPHLGLGALSVGKGAQILSESNPDGEFYPEMANRAAGMGYVGAGAGLVKQGLRYGAAPGVAPDAQALAVINSNQLRRNNLLSETPEAPPPKPLTPRGALVEQARAAGIKSVGKKNMGQLQAALDAINKGTKGAAIPLTAGALAYAMTPDRAEAADGSAVGGRAEALTNAAGATGATYGVGKALGALPGVVRRAGGGALSALMPMAAADAYDPTQEQLNMDRNQAARTFPSFLRGGAVEDAYQMSQVPTQAPVKLSEGPRRPDFNKALADFEALMAGQ